MDALKIENPPPLQKICIMFAFELFDELKVSKIFFGKNGELSLKPKTQEIFRYFKRLSKSLLQVLLTEYLEKIYTKEYVNLQTSRNYSISNNNNTLLFLLFGLPVPVECNLILLSTPVVKFVERYSKNLSCLTLISYNEIKSVKQMRNLFFVLKNLEELVIESCEEIILYCLTVIRNYKILPALKSLCICSNEFQNDAINSKSQELLWVRKLNNFQMKLKKMTYLHIVFHEEGWDIQKLKFNSDFFSNELITRFLFSARRVYGNICSLDLNSKDLQRFPIFDSSKSVIKLKSLKLSSTESPLCFQECLVILKRCPKLEILHLHNCTDVNFVDLIINNQLKELVFTGCTFKLDMVSRNHFIRLKHLKIADCKIPKVLFHEIINVASCSPNIRKLEIFSSSSNSYISEMDISDRLAGFLMPIRKYYFENSPVAGLQGIEELSFCACACTAAVLETFLSLFKSLKILKIACLIVPIDEMEHVMEYFTNSSVLVAVHWLLDEGEAMMLANDKNDKSSLDKRFRFLDFYEFDSYDQFDKNVHYSSSDDYDRYDDYDPYDYGDNY